ncbi:hypothetical protein M0657_002899 [Pyricularia oryzae]|nr:hypothetical protein M9X92_003739 [Pyricularia oryzae]KAI7928058.1 hypothetical protein M0657_002899 [Pyricularia oryzae]
MALFTLTVNPEAVSLCGTKRIGLFKLGWAQGRVNLDHARHFTLKQKGPTMTATLLSLEGEISARERVVFANVAFTLLLAKHKSKREEAINRSAAAEDREAGN